MCLKNSALKQYNTFTKAEGQWSRIETAEENPHIHSQLIFDRKTEKSTGKSLSLSTDALGTVGYPLTEVRNKTSTLWFIHR